MSTLLTMPCVVDAMLPAEVVDGIAERIVLSAEPGDRAAVINGLVAEMYATVAWRQGAGGGRCGVGESFAGWLRRRRPIRVGWSAAGQAAGR